MAAPATGAGGKPVKIPAFAKLIDVTPRHVRRLCDEGVLTRAGRGEVLFPQAVHQYIRHLRELQAQRAARATAKRDPELGAIKRVHLRIQVRRELLALEEEESRYIEVALVDASLGAIHRALTKGLRELPKRKAHHFPDDPTAPARLVLATQEAIKELDSAVDEARASLPMPRSLEGRRARAAPSQPTLATPTPAAAASAYSAQSSRSRGAITSKANDCGSKGRSPRRNSSGVATPSRTASRKSKDVA